MKRKGNKKEINPLILKTRTNESGKLHRSLSCFFPRPNGLKKKKKKTALQINSKQPNGAHHHFSWPLRSWDPCNPVDLHELVLRIEQGL